MSPGHLHDEYTVKASRRRSGSGTDPGAPSAASEAAGDLVGILSWILLDVALCAADEVYMANDEQISMRRRACRRPSATSAPSSDGER
jgi:hypothetical protein